MLEIKTDGIMGCAWIIDFDWEDGSRFGNDVALVFEDTEDGAVKKLQNALWEADPYCDIRNVLKVRRASLDDVVCNKTKDIVRGK